MFYQRQRRRTTTKMSVLATSVGPCGTALFTNVTSLLSRLHPRSRQTGQTLVTQSAAAAGARSLTVADIVGEHSDLSALIDPFVKYPSLGSDLLQTLAAECRRGGIRRPALMIGNSTLSLDLRSGICYLQKRGFRSRAYPTGVGMKGKEDNSSASIADKLFGRWPEQQSLANSKVSDAGVGKLVDDVREQMNKLPDKEKNAYVDGFVQAYGLASHKQSQANDRSAEKIRSFSVSRMIRGVFSALTSVLLIYVLFAVLSDMMRQKGGPMSFFSRNVSEVEPEDITVTLRDVRGMDEAKFEVEEIVSYLRYPERYSKLGGRLPKGVLLVGPPGTGKTLLARAIAGEAEVPFFHAAGSEFDEILVGQGARRVRDLFAAAKAKAPCVIFIDEMDSVGAKRVTTNLHPYANQTVNQLLTEMDGFRRNEGIIIIGATNRIDDLDKALLRPGRFDIQVNVAAPDLKGRREIFELYLGNIVTGDDLNLDALARRTTGFTGADIESMANQAALRAAADGSTFVNMHHLEEARDRVLMGPQRLKGRLPDEEANRITAYHEAGHTLVAFFTKDSIPLHKVTIIPRGQSLGHTAVIPDKEEYHMTRSQMLAQLDMLMGGRVAEELVFGQDKVTTGAASDLHKATQLASEMVKTFGMSEKVGLRDFSVQDRTGIVVTSELSPATIELIDQEIRRLLHESYDRAKDILMKHQKEHKRLAETLFEYETLDAEEVKMVIEGKTLAAKKKIEVVPTEPAPGVTLAPPNGTKIPSVL